MKHECAVCGATFGCDAAAGDEPTLLDLFAIAGLIAGAVAFKNAPGDWDHASMASMGYAIGAAMLAEKANRARR